MLNFSNDPEVAEQQMRAIIFHLTAFGYIDGEFDLSERDFVRDYIRRLVESRAKSAMPEASDAVREEVVDRFTAHFHEVFEQIDREVSQLYTEAVAENEDQKQFVGAKLKLRSYEMFQSFDLVNQMNLLETIEELIMADGKLHPAEAAFRDELQGLLQNGATMDNGIANPPETSVELLTPTHTKADSGDVPALSGVEEHYSADPQRLKQQSDIDRKLITDVMDSYDKRAKAGLGKLGTAKSIDDIEESEPFLDGHVHIHPVGDDQEIDVTVLGDLHGCYSCLKAALLQSNFFAKLEAYKLQPNRAPKPLLVLLGDYIDRGHFSYNGVLRAVMRIYLEAPEHVFFLRGNHEHYIEYNGRIYGGVKPAEAITTLIGHMPEEMFSEYMNLFESLPNSLILGRLLFVHAGIPRDATIRERFSGLASLNDPKIRFEMMWSDPSKADAVPETLQAVNARFPFGRNQFESFMSRIGCDILFRGHEKIESGFASIYPQGGRTLINLFSAGGRDNDDLPKTSSYRRVTPMAASIAIKGKDVKIRPWEIDYMRFNDAATNAFFASEPEIQFRSK